MIYRRAINAKKNQEFRRKPQLPKLLECSDCGEMVSALTGGIFPLPSGIGFMTVNGICDDCFKRLLAKYGGKIAL